MRCVAREERGRSVFSSSLMNDKHTHVNPEVGKYCAHATTVKPLGNFVYFYLSGAKAVEPRFIDLERQKLNTRFYSKGDPKREK